MKISKDVIEERESKLESTKIYLKSQFIGIDEIIDKFIDGVRDMLLPIQGVKKAN